MKYKIGRSIVLVLIVVMLPLACGPTQYTLNTSVSPAGAGTITPSGGKYDAGTEMTIVAEPASEYAFDKWSGDIPSDSGHLANITITIDDDKTITAYFKAQYIVTASVSPSGSGFFSPNMPHIYDAGKIIEVSAYPNDGYIFDHWSGDVTGISNTAAIMMDGNKNIVAYFKKRFSPLALAPVCKGIGIPEAAAYNPHHEGKHPVVLLSSNGNEHEWSDDLPAEWWHPTAIEEVQLVICVGEEGENVLGTCEYDAPAPLNIVTRYQFYLPVTIREAKTGRIIVSTNVYGWPGPPNCKPTEGYYVTRSEGSHVSLDYLLGELQYYISP
jgi:hypothetical protein